MKRLVVGICGASGAIYGIRLLTVLQDMAGVETHLVLTAAARPATLEAVIDQTVNRALDQLDVDLDADLFVRWNGPPQPNSLKER